MFGMNTTKLPAFKAYDIRGIMPTELNPSMAYHIGRGLAETTGAKTAIVGMDSRLSSPGLLNGLATGLTSAGVSVKSLGLCGTEEIYHAGGAGHCDIGIMVTASHSPIEYNGMKFVKRGGLPFEAATDLAKLEEYTRTHLHEETPSEFPSVPQISLREEYVDYLMQFIDSTKIPAQTIVINAGNGAAGPTADAILARLPQLEVIRLNHMPDGTFPVGIPNPLLPQNREGTSNAVREHGASLGIAWDGDFDRCFFTDENGTFISSYYIAGMLAATILKQFPGSTIVHDPRLFWDTQDAVEAAGGTCAIAKVGHSNIKPAMRSHNSPFCGEISGHFYFRDFFFCDTGMLPMLLVLQYLGTTGQTLGQCVTNRALATPASDEINFVTPVPAKEYLATLKPHFVTEGEITEVDGVSAATPEWRANIRTSNTEPLLRLNVEARNPEKLAQQLEALTKLITSHGAHPADH